MPRRFYTAVTALLAALSLAALAGCQALSLLQRRPRDTVCNLRLDRNSRLCYPIGN